MGFDAVKPFLRKGKWGILLIATSNPSASSIQNIVTHNGNPLYLDIVNESYRWSNEANMMFVVGATRTQEMFNIRSKAPNHFFLVPGVGVQGGNLSEVCNAAFNDHCGLLINVSRSIIYAGAGEKFKDDIYKSCFKIQQEMELILKNRKFIS